MTTGATPARAYVFVRNGTTWTQQQKLTASDGAFDDFLGFSVSVSGDTALVGAWQDDDNGSNSGSAYVFLRIGTTWSQQQKLTDSDGADEDRFGYAVSIIGETALVSSYRDDGNAANSGTVFVFARSGTSWSEQQKLIASDGEAFDSLGLVRKP